MVVSLKISIKYKNKHLLLITLIWNQNPINVL
nr:MAG TPA: hypothetical protein [Bacteriophage sp.]DAU12276.1 MAG TPA: hypothetical protein [Caudoviricetes sp.]